MAAPAPARLRRKVRRSILMEGGLLLAAVPRVESIFAIGREAVKGSLRSARERRGTGTSFPAAASRRSPDRVEGRDLGGRGRRATEWRRGRWQPGGRGGRRAASVLPERLGAGDPHGPS